jgi:hypothetical protein
VEPVNDHGGQSAELIGLGDLPGQLTGNLSVAIPGVRLDFQLTAASRCELIKLRPLAGGGRFPFGRERPLRLEPIERRIERPVVDIELAPGQPQHALSNAMPVIWL